MLVNRGARWKTWIPRWRRWSSLLVLGVCVLLGVMLAIAPSLQAQTDEMAVDASIIDMERRLEGEFEQYFDRDLPADQQNPDQIAATLTRIGQETGTHPAVLWVTPKPDSLRLVLITSGHRPVVVESSEVPQALLQETVRSFQRDMTRGNRRVSLDNAQQLHRWIIEPFESEYLRPQGIDSLLFCLSDGARGLTLAALHDGQQFLLEKYALTRIPAFNLIHTNVTNIQQGELLAMGASEFQQLNPLPAVPVELSTITAQMESVPGTNITWDAQTFLNEEFTLDNFQAKLAERPYDIVHLATHAEFQPGKPDRSFIQFWDARLTLEQMGVMDWHTDQLELLVLSACRTAVGDAQAELGFAGLALQSNVKSALASLWYVSDAGTLALMTEFYRQLAIAPTRAEALRQAQLRLLRGDVRFEGDQLLMSRGAIPLPKPLAFRTERDLSHPIYWAGFSLISSPW
ncbi:MULTISPECIES: CHAT domain-containing protein [unclassified Leptolyngbya]|uniref:CHAT domain-containing protein n=1 Tax=unclassified Leptolyngbya TaxID=2650499 RepID=UPI0016899089|nr:MULTISPECIES: CHAT domain-containing protein [unclassified Leptolyngbya]MBD1912631.1 CHAT domain-containing protein [Leptolyngbya sp. FACHB-8]MBD2156801.1 CHAT domain-containing protein [Leptolyngbya sp. FACHB-16]